MKENYLFRKILGLLILSLFVASCSDFGITTGGGCPTPTSISPIIASGRIPVNLSDYDQAAQDIFSPYPAGAAVVARYVATNGMGDGNTYATAASNVKTVLNGITNAAANKVYVVLIAPGTYDAGKGMGMKNHVAIVGGQCSANPTENAPTILSGGGTHQVFNNYKINNTAVLYGVTVANGKSVNGGGMYNGNSSPVITRVIFSNNHATNGGGMFNSFSSPLITKTTFFWNRNCNFGAGMYNWGSSPVLVGVTFSENRCLVSGAGMFSSKLSSPVLVGVTFFNLYTGGGGITMTEESEPNDNENDVYGDGPLLINTIMWGNKDNDNYIHFYNKISKTIPLRIYNSIVRNGLSPDYESGTPVAHFYKGGITSKVIGTGKIVVFFSGVISDDPYLEFIKDIDGVSVHFIPKSGAVNRGLYVRRSAAPTGKGCGGQCDIYTYYFSDNGKDWFSSPELTTTATPPADTIDLTATDATGYKRTGRPDLGAYEAR